VRQHDLEDVAGGDVVLGPRHHAAEGGLIDGGVEVGRRNGLDLALDRQGAAQAVLEILQPGLGGGVGLSRVRHRVGIGGGDQDDLVLHRIEDGDQRRTRHDGVGQVQRVRVGRAQRLQQAHHVIAEHAEQTGGHGGQVSGQLELRRRDQGA